MEIKAFKKENLSLEQKAFVYKLLSELWDVEESLLPHIPAQYGGIEFMFSSAYNRLGDVLLGFVGEEPVGFIANHYLSNSDVEKLVIAKEHKRKGYGRCLVNALCLVADRWLEVCITPGNNDAINFYKGIGFELSEHSCETTQFLIGCYDWENNHGISKIT